MIVLSSSPKVDTEPKNVKVETVTVTEAKPEPIVRSKATEPVSEIVE